MPLADRFRDMFKSEKEVRREQEKARRRAFREADRSMGTVKDRIAKLKKERDGAWGDARKYLHDGQKGASQRCLQTVRANEMMIAKLEKKRWVFEQLVTKLELAKTDQDFAESLKAVQMVVNVDPDALDEVMADVGLKIEEQDDTDKIWDREHAREMEGVEGEMTDAVPSVEDMEKQLMDEVAADLESARPAKSAERAEGEPETSVPEQIGEARKNLRKLMEEEGNE